MPREHLKAATHRARSLRMQSTDAEWKVWSFLRARQLGGLKFRRQVPIGRYFADFACLDLRLVVEIDGSQHFDNPDRDAERTRALERFGWHVVRFDNRQALTNPEGVAEAILAEARLARP